MAVTRDYYEYLNKFHVVTGTDKDDKFLITRKKDGVTDIQISSKDKIVFENSYNAQDTKEIWIYGLMETMNLKLKEKEITLLN